MANTFDIYQNCQNELSLVFPLEMIGDNTLRVLFYTFHVALINLAFADMTRFEVAPPHFQVGNISRHLKYSETTETTEP